MRMTVHQAVALRDAIAAGKATDAEIKNGAEQLIRVLAALEAGERVVKQISQGPWPAVRRALARGEEWLERNEPPRGLGTGPR